MSLTITLEREQHTDQPCPGRLTLPRRLGMPDIELATLERAWRGNRGDLLGASPAEASSVPLGRYQLEPFTRPGGDEVWRLYNPALRVFRDRDEASVAKGRYLILIHAANYAEDIVGCIAPGTKHAMFGHHGLGVASSGDAMRMLHGRLDGVDELELLIREALGPVRVG